MYRAFYTKSLQYGWKHSVDVCQSTLCEPVVFWCHTTCVMLAYTSSQIRPHNHTPPYDLNLWGPAIVDKIWHFSSKFMHEWDYSSVKVSKFNSVKFLLRLLVMETGLPSQVVSLLSLQEHLVAGPLKTNKQIILTYC